MRVKATQMMQLIVSQRERNTRKIQSRMATLEHLFLPKSKWRTCFLLIYKFVSRMETDSAESMNPPAGDFKAPMPMAPPMGLPVAFGSKKPVQPKKRPPPIQKTDNNKKPTKNEEKEELDPNQPKFKHAETAEEKERTVYVSNMDYKLKNPEKELKKI